MTEKKGVDSDVPEELQQRQKNKQIAEERAEDAIAQEVTRGECFLSAIGYIGFLCVLPLVLMPKSKFAQFHGKQALVLAIMLFFLDVIQILPTPFEFAYTVVKIVVIVYAAYMALHAKMIRIPFVYDLSGRFEIHVQKDN